MGHEVRHRGPQPLGIVPSELNRIRYTVPNLSIRLIEACLRRLLAHENRVAYSKFIFSWKVFTCLRFEYRSSMRSGSRQAYSTFIRLNDLRNAMIFSSLLPLSEC